MPQKCIFGTNIVHFENNLQKHLYSALNLVITGLQNLGGCMLKTNSQAEVNINNFISYFTMLEQTHFTILT